MIKAEMQPIKILGWGGEWHASGHTTIGDRKLYDCYSSKALVSGRKPRVIVDARDIEFIKKEDG